MKNKKSRIRVFMMGIPSMIVIFIGLCFALMAALAVFAAKSDYQLSLDLAQHTTEYYCAVNQAEQKLADPISLYKERDSNYQTLIDIKMNEEQTLTVILQFQPNSMEYQILKYQVINEREWDGDSLLPELLLPQP